MSEVNDSPIEVLRHSAAHLLAHAVLDLYPETKTGIGPAVETGFYYDFLRETPFTPEDLEMIEKRMKEIAAENTPIGAPGRAATRSTCATCYRPRAVRATT